MASYRRALTMYREFVDGEHSERLVVAAIRGTLQQLGALDKADGDDRKRPGPAKRKGGRTVRLTVPNSLDEREARERDSLNFAKDFRLFNYVIDTKPATATKKSDTDDTSTIRSLIDRYCRHREPETQVIGGRKALSPGGFNSIKQGLKTFQEFVGRRVWSESDPQVNEQLLADYRAYLLKKVETGDYKANTFNDKVKHLKRHFRWLYQQRMIIEMPRNVDEACAKIKTQKQGKPLTVDQVHAIWAVARNEVRCWIAVGLNCGFYSKDISDLRPHDVDAVPGYVCRKRVKSDVPSRHLLWPVTQKLIDRLRYRGEDAGDRPLFLSGKRKVMNESGRDLLGHQFKQAAKKAGVSASFSQLRDTGAEYIENCASHMTTYDPALVQLYLSHRDSRTAVFYLSNDPTTMQVPHLDKALRSMNKHFALKV